MTSRARAFSLVIDRFDTSRPPRDPCPPTQAQVSEQPHDFASALTRYRSDLSRIDTDIRAVVGLQKLKEQFAERRLTFDRIKKTGIVSR